jgi:diguanylate cyclase (GGDEF)-like protein
LARLATEFTAVLNLPDLLDRVMLVLHEETGFDSCTVALLEGRSGDNLTIRSASGIRTSYRGLVIPREQGLHWAVMKAGTPLLVPDMTADPRVYRRLGDVRSGIYTPLMIHGHPIGVLAAHRTDVDAFTEADLNLLTVVARYLAGAVEVARLHDELKELAATDPLTGLANRRCFLDRLAAELARSRRTNRAFSIALLDLDGLKAINDVHGHGVGDQVLIQVAAALKQSARASDLAARLGGDEFVLLFPETSSAQAEAHVSRLQPIEISVPNGATKRLQMSFCWGSAAWPEDGQDLERLMQVADTRLYVRKQRLPKV